ncbi:MAG: response regulator [Phormidesmis sp.]
MRILLVEDDESVAKILKKVLTEENYVVDVASDGYTGWQLVNVSQYNLVILDVLLPELDGLEFCRQLRENHYNMPVLFVTALGESSKKVAGLNAGADDYITKPFELEELLARVRALLRRVNTSVVLSLVWRELRLDVNSRDVSYGNNKISLTPKEHAILELFLRNPSQAFSRQAIIDNLWTLSEAPGEETVTSHMKGLRRKLKQAGAPTDFIETVYGVGYRLKPLTQKPSSSKQSLPTDSSSPDPATANADPNLVNLRQKRTKAALSTLWKSVKRQQIDRLEILKQAVSHLQQGELSKDLRRSAYRSAHSLTGVLGIFALSKGSELANKIQLLIQGEQPISKRDALQIKALVQALTATIEKAGNDHTKAAIKTLKLPLLVLIDPRLDITSALVSALWAAGFTVKISQCMDALSAMTSAFDQINTEIAKEINTSVQAGYATERSTVPDVILHRFSFSESSSTPLSSAPENEKLKQMADLLQSAPNLAALICSADGSLPSRVKAARLGDFPFFYNPEVDSVIETISLLRSHTQPQTIKILAVDDDPAVLQALSTRLAPQGYQIVTLDKSVTFWETLQAETPDLLLLDISMPDFTGIELCKAIRRAPTWSHLPVVFFTSHTDIQIQQVALTAGADKLIDKSTPDAQLFFHISHQIQRSHLRQSIKQTIATAANRPLPCFP